MKSPIAPGARPGTEWNIVFAPLEVGEMRQIRPASWGFCVTVIYYGCVSVRRREQVGSAKSCPDRNGIAVRGHTPSSSPHTRLASIRSSRSLLSFVPQSQGDLVASSLSILHRLPCCAAFLPMHAMQVIPFGSAEYPALPSITAYRGRRVIFCRGPVPRLGGKVDA